MSWAISSVSSPALFDGAVATSGDNVVFTPEGNANGSSTFVLTGTDSGPSVGDGDDNEFDITVTVNVTEVNDDPTATGIDQSIAEDASPALQTVLVGGWAADLGPGGGTDESGQELSYSGVSSTEPTLFDVAPAIDPVDGTLTYTPAAEMFGTSTVTVTISDDGDDSPPPNDNTKVVSFDIVIDSLNDAPAFTFANPTVAEDSGASQPRDQRYQPRPGQ